MSIYDTNTDKCPLCSSVQVAQKAAQPFNPLATIKAFHGNIKDHKYASAPKCQPPIQQSVLSPNTGPHAGPNCRRCRLLLLPLMPVRSPHKAPPHPPDACPQRISQCQPRTNPQRPAASTAQCKIAIAPCHPKMRIALHRSLCAALHFPLSLCLYAHRGTGSFRVQGHSVVIRTYHSIGMVPRCCLHLC